MNCREKREEILRRALPLRGAAGQDDGASEGLRSPLRLACPPFQDGAEKSNGGPVLCFATQFASRSAMALFASKETPISKTAPGRADGAPVPAETFLGPNLIVEGTIQGSDLVTIEGTVKGEIRLSGDLRIGTKAKVEAKVHARRVSVEGKLTGDISADERVELVASATVDGNIKAPKIVVAEGAKFRGSVDMGSTRPKEQPEASSAKK